jgi:hypothetical protein
MSSPLDLTTLANVKEYLSITNTTSDSLLSRLITACSTYAATYCSRTFQLTTYNESRNGLGGTTLTMKNQPITGVSAVSVNGVNIVPRPPLGPGSATGYGFGYTFDRTRVMLSGTCFYQGQQNVAITYAAGYATTPADLEQAIIDWVGDEFKYKDRIGKASEGIEGQTIAFISKGIPPRVQSVLNIYNTVAPAY